MELQGIAEDIKCGRFCLTLGAQFLHESLTSWVIIGTVCNDIFTDKPLNWENSRITIPNIEILSVKRQLTQLIHMF